MSILATSPTAIRVMDMNIAAALGSIEAALILQQLHYWTEKKGIGVIVDNAKYIYNTFEQWVKNQFTVLSVWKFRQAMNILRSLSIVEVIRYKSRQWNQTNYYSLNYVKLQDWAKAESIEISEMWSTSPQGDEYQTLKMENTSTSYIETKNTNQKSTAKQESNHDSNKSNSIAAATSKEALEGEKSQTEGNPSFREVNCCSWSKEARIRSQTVKP